MFLTVQINGLAYLGPGGVANVAVTWLFVVLGWLVCVRRSLVPADLPAPSRHARVS